MVSETVFNKAVQTARDYLASVEGKKLPYCPNLATSITSQNAVYVGAHSDYEMALQYPLDDSFEDDRLCTIIEGARYHVKLYSVSNPHNNTLIEMALTRYNVFDDLVKQLAWEVENGFNVAPEFLSFTAKLLRKEVKRPRKPTNEENYVRKINLAQACYLVIKEHGLTHTRNDATDPQWSALDAVAEAAKISFGTMKKDIYPLRDIWEWKLRTDNTGPY